MTEKRTITITKDAGSALDIDHEIVAETLKAFRAMNAVVPLSSFEFKYRAASNPAVFDYQFEAADGRTWEQVLTFDQTGTLAELSDPLQTFEVGTPGFRLSEFVHQRSVRDLMVKAFANFALRSLEITWETT